MSEYVCVIGGANIDISGTSTDKLNARDSNPGIVNTSLGGVGRNIAENLSRMGVRVEFISILGNDNYSRDIQESCKELNISLEHSLILDDKRTSIYLCVNDEEGDMAVAISDMEIYEMITPEFLKERLDIINNSRACISDTNIPKESLTFLMENVKVPIFIDTVSIHKTEKIKDNLHNIHGLKPNILEAEILSGIKISSDDDVKKAADILLGKGIKQLFLTLGSNGVYITDGKYSGQLPTMVKKIVNATGAGDSFIAGVVFGFLKGYDIEKCARTGLAASSICLMSRDTVSKEISEDNILKLLKNTEVM